MRPIHHCPSSLFVRTAIVLVVAGALWPALALALNGQVRIHDPSTIMECDGKYYTYGTGGTPLASNDGWTWYTGTRASASGAAPDVIRVGDKYFQYISHGTMIWTKSLDPNSPDYEWHEGGRNVFGMESEDDFMNPIDPGTFLDPTTGKLWVTYGSYFGYTRVVELDTETGLRVDDKYYNVAVNCEATTMIYHDGWYYLLATHGSCCAGPSSSYNIRVGRSRNVTGPFIDNMGIDMMIGGGKLVVGSGGRFIGPGHFGLIDCGDGVQKFSLHWEADLDLGGASVVDILPLLWKDGWPIAGENLKEGTYEIESARTGTALELAVEGVPVGGGRGRGGRGGGAGMMGGARGGARGMAPGGAAGGGARAGMRGMAPGGAAPEGAAPGGARAGMRGMAPGGGAAPGGMAPGGAFGGARAGMGGEAPAGGGMMGGARGGGMMGGGGGMFGGSGTPIPDQDAAEVSANWPDGDVGVRMAVYMCQAQQKWTFTAAPDGSGYLGSPYFKITVAGTDRTLAVGPDGELIGLETFTGAPEQLWRVDQLADGTYRIMPKAMPNSTQPMALSAVGSSFATLSKYDPDSDKYSWLLKTP